MIEGCGYKILVTGASGFIGKVLCQALREKGHDVIAVVRHQQASENTTGSVVIPTIDGTTSWEGKLDGIEVIVHLAAKAHIPVQKMAGQLAEFRKINTQGTLHLANCAAQAGVKRFVFLSSIGVNGNQSVAPFNESSVPNPVEPYAVSKWEAEEGLKNIADTTGMELVIVRPPLVYGANCPGNFLALLGLIYSGLPLPLCTINNKRSFIGIDNLADFLALCVEKPGAANKTFLIADNEAISTPNLIRMLATAMHKPALLFPMPYPVLHAAAALIGKAPVLDKLCGTLQIDASLASKALNWQQPKSSYDGLKETAIWYADYRAGRT
jgi:nucleoside-diphosphate-sugar epimerase